MYQATAYWSRVFVIIMYEFTAKPGSADYFGYQFFFRELHVSV